MATAPPRARRTILYLTPGVEVATGGIAEAVVQTAGAARRAGYGATVWAPEPDGDSVIGRLSALGVDVWTFPALRGTFRFSPGMLRAALAARPVPDLVHAHGVWSAPTLLGLFASRVCRGRLVVSPHGQLDSWSMAQRSWKKRPYLRAFEALSRRSRLVWHATGEIEAGMIAGWRVPGQVCVVPLSVEPAARLHVPRAAQALRVLFLGRIHPKKQLHVAIAACAALRDRGKLESFEIVGNLHDEKYGQRLRKQVADLRLADQVKFAGVLVGEAKARALASADVLVLPSLEENFGLVVAEAASAGLPVVVSDQVGLHPDVRQAGAGRVVPAGDARALADALGAMSDPVARADASAAGRALAERRFTRAAMAAALDGLYQRAGL